MFPHLPEHDRSVLLQLVRVADKLPQHVRLAPAHAFGGGNDRGEAIESLVDASATVLLAPDVVLPLLLFVEESFGRH